MADRLALSLINRRQLGERDFVNLDNGAVSLKEASRKTVLTAYQERKREELRHSFLEEKVAVGLFPQSRRSYWLVICVAIWKPIHRFCGSELS